MFTKIAEPSLTLTAEEASKIGKTLYTQIEQDEIERAPMLRKIQAVRELYFGSKSRQAIYEGDSDIHLYVITEKVEGLVPKVINAFFNADPITHVRRVPEEHNSDGTEKQERYINWALVNDIPKLYSTFEKWVRNSFLDGVSVLNPSWLFKTKYGSVKEKISLYWQVGDTDHVGTQVTEQRIKVPAEILLDIFGTEDKYPQKGILSELGKEAYEEHDIDSLDGMEFVVDIIDNRIKYEGVRVVFEKGLYVDEINVCVYRHYVDCDRPELGLLEIEDCIIPFRSTDLQTAERVACRYWQSISDIDFRRQKEYWDVSEEEFEFLQARATGRAKSFEEYQQMSQELKRQKDRILGEHGEHARAVDDTKTQNLVFYEIYTTHTTEYGCAEVIYQMSHDLKKIVRADYLTSIYPHGRRPLIDLHYLRVSDRYYSISLGQLLAPINIETNAIFNMVNEAQELVNHPWYTYVPTSMPIDPKVLGRIMPGQGVPVAEKGAMEFPKFPQEPLANLSSLDTLLMFADRLTVSPQSVGSSQVRNAPRTARGTLALLSEASIKTDMYITAAQEEAWPELMHQIMALYSYYGPKEKYYYVTGDNNPHRISSEELRGRYTFYFKGNSVNTNREVTRSIAQLRYSTLVTNPLYSMDMNALSKLTDDFIKHFSEGADVDGIRPQLPQKIGSHAPMDQMSEIRMIHQGAPLDALPIDNHVEHMDVISRFQMSKEFQLWEPWQVSLLAKHYTEHAQLLAQQRASGGPIPPGAGMSNNQSTGMTAGSGEQDLNALEGGIQ